MLIAGSAAATTGPVLGWGAGAAPGITATAIASGGHHDCAIQDGTSAVVCWGGNGWGQAIALPEPDPALVLASAVVGLVTLGRRRIRK